MSERTTMSGVEQSPDTSAASSGADEAGSNKPADDMSTAADSRSGESRSKRNDLLDLRKYLLLLAILVATVTYVAGLNPPGGVWLDTKDGHLTGNQILVVTYHVRYNAFSYSNATAFMASAVVILLLILVVNKEKGNRSALFVVLRVVIELDLVALLVSYAAGASRDRLTTVWATILVSLDIIYILVVTGTDFCRYCASTLSSNPKAHHDDDNDDDKELKRRHKILMLFAIFVTTITYTAGLNPPGGFWPVSQEGHRAGDPVLQSQDNHDRGRFIVFFICNTGSFVTSLLIVLLLLNRQSNRRYLLLRRIYGGGAMFYYILTTILVYLLLAYATGSCRGTHSSTYVAVLCLIFLANVYVLVLVYAARRVKQQEGNNREKVDAQSSKKSQEKHPHGLNTARSLVLLLATLAATVTYQAGLNPPGGIWPDDRDGHKGGDPILLTKHATRYRVFFYFNSTALAASLVVIFMVQRNCLSVYGDLGRHVLEAVMVLDLIGLIGAFAVGCCRDVSTSIYVIALAGGALVYVVFHMVFFTMHHKEDLHKADLTVENKRKLLLLLAILAVTLTYQAGLTPPGGFWLEDGDDVQLGHHAGDPVLLSNYPRRYTAFFYLNATGFMASVALTILLVNSNLYIAAIKCHALYVYMVASLFGLMGAYAAGSSRHVRTSIYMIALIALVFAVILLLLLIATRWVILEGVRKWILQWISACMGSANNQGAALPAPHSDVNGEDTRRRVTAPPANDIIELHTKRRYLTLLGILAASVTYQAGLAPPGGVWPDNSDGHTVGNPILRDSNNLRYNIFYYFNSISFVASVVVITLQLLFVRITSPRTEESEEAMEENKQAKSEEAMEENKQAKFLIQAADYTMAVGLLGLVGAYAAGSSREWKIFGYFMALVAAVPLYIVIHLLVYWCHQSCFGNNGSTASQQKGESCTGSRC